MRGRWDSQLQSVLMNKMSSPYSDYSLLEKNVTDRLFVILTFITSFGRTFVL